MSFDAWRVLLSNMRSFVAIFAGVLFPVFLSASQLEIERQRELYSFHFKKGALKRMSRDLVWQTSSTGRPSSI